MSPYYAHNFLGNWAENIKVLLNCLRWVFSWLYSKPDSLQNLSKPKDLVELDKESNVVYDHEMNWEEWKVIDTEPYVYTRKIKETVHSIKYKNHIHSISYNLLEIWIPIWIPKLRQINT